jgi:hypothetical protein
MYDSYLIFICYADGTLNHTQLRTTELDKPTSNDTSGTISPNPVCFGILEFWMSTSLTRAKKSGGI